MKRKFVPWVTIILVILGFLLIIGSCHGAQAPFRHKTRVPHALPKNFIYALHMVETGGRLGPILGDHGHALGPFQIHKRYWQDAHVSGSYSQCADYNYSVMVITSYLNRYAPNFNCDTLARVHNGGPRGYKRKSTLKYWKLVDKYLHCDSITP